jgi:CPA2 family monovalent cation:H+ antiporter-2
MLHSVYAQLLLTLTSTVLLVALFRRLNLPTILAYLMVGFVMGQMGFEVFASDSNTYLIAEIGIVFMLFTLGLEFSIPRVIAMRKQVLGLGSLQVALTTVILLLILMLFAVEAKVALLLGAALAMSSTAIVTKQLSDQREFNQRHGILSVATLLFQDMAAVPLLILVPILASASTDLMATSLFFALIKGVAAFALIILLGKRLLPKVFHEITRVHSDELFVMTSVAVALITSWFTHTMGLSMALGAFLAGMLLAESHFKNQIETEIRPFRDILLGLFFITIGSLIQVDSLLRHWPLILGGLIVFVLLKFTLVMLIALMMKEKKEDSFKTAMVLAHAGELGFVLIGLATKHQMLHEPLASIVLSIGVLSMFASPFLIGYAEPFSRKLFGVKASAREQSQSKQKISEAVKDVTQHIIICGFGRNGQTIKRFLDRFELPSVILDLDPKRVKEAATAGESIFYGDATRRSILQAAAIEQARLVIVTFDDLKSTYQLLSVTQQHFPQVPVLVRTKDDSNLETLLNAGAHIVVPESLESSLMLVGQVLYTLGLSTRRIVTEIQRVRNDRYQMLQSFFHGESSDLMRVLQTHHEQLHPVVLTETAYAIGKTISEIDLPEKIFIEALKRGDDTFTPPDRRTQLQAGDIVVLSGDPESIERAENQLLSG